MTVYKDPDPLKGTSEPSRLKQLNVRVRPGDLSMLQAIADTEEKPLAPTIVALAIEAASSKLADPEYQKKVLARREERQAREAAEKVAMFGMTTRDASEALHRKDDELWFLRDD